MKKLYFLFTFLLLSFVSFAQTTLSPGDLVITSIIADENDRFQFTPLVDLEAGTVIYFTDTGWNATTGAWRNDDFTEGCISYTAPTAVSSGTVITVSENSLTNGLFDAPTDGSMLHTDFGNSFALSTSGDAIIAFQGTPPASWDASTDTNPFPNPTFLFVATQHSTAWHDATSTKTTAIPTGLVEGTTAVAVGSGDGSGDEYDNAYYDATANPLNNKSQSEILALVGNPANWVGDNSVPTGWEITSFTTLSSKAFELENVNVYPNPISKGNEYITISSRLNDKMEVSVYNLLGKQLIKETITNNLLKVTQLKAGIYLLKIAQDNKHMTRKIIIE